MRGHIGDLEEIKKICDENNVTLIEDCAHALGATFNSKKVGSFGLAGCYSMQAYKQINAGEMGMCITNDDDLCARIIITSGSYMLYNQHGTLPSDKIFEKWQYTEPNFSMRASEFSAGIA